MLKAYLNTWHINIQYLKIKTSSGLFFIKDDKYGAHAWYVYFEMYFNINYDL